VCYGWSETRQTKRIGIEKNLKYQLIQRAQTGDPLAMSDLLTYCKTDIRRYAEKNCRLSDIEDATQESMLAIHQTVSKLKSLEAFSSWLFIIVKRECQRAMRIAYRFLSSEDIAVSAQVSDLDLRSDLLKAMESLSPPYLQVILLRDFEELSVGEIAQRLGEEIPAIKSRIHRAREMMREYLNS
jgi:RNA polymerase sigma factor (sigma-70 family)